MSMTWGWGGGPVYVFLRVGRPSIIFCEGAGRPSWLNLWPIMKANVIRILHRIYGLFLSFKNRHWKEETFLCHLIHFTYLLTANMSSFILNLYFILTVKVLNALFYQHDRPVSFTKFLYNMKQSPFTFCNHNRCSNKEVTCKIAVCILTSRIPDLALYWSVATGVWRRRRRDAPVPANPPGSPPGGHAWSMDRDDGRKPFKWHLFTPQTNKWADFFCWFLRVVLLAVFWWCCGIRK